MGLSTNINQLIKNELQIWNISHMLSYFPCWNHVKSPFSQGFPMVFPLKPPCSYGFPMVFPLKPPCSYGFPMVFPLKPPFSYGFPMVFPLKPPFSYGLPRVFLWFHQPPSRALPPCARRTRSTQRWRRPRHVERPRSASTATPRSSVHSSG